MLYGMVTKGFLPQQDTGLLIGITDAAQDISFPAMQARQNAVAEIVARDPAVVAVDSFVGAGSVNPTLNSGRLYINIGAPDRRAPLATRCAVDHRTAAKRDRRRRRAFRCICNRRRTSRSRPAPPARNTSTCCRIWTRRSCICGAGGCCRPCARARNSPMSRPTSKRTASRSCMSIDRQAAARFGVTLAAIDQTLYDAFGQRQIATVYARGGTVSRGDGGRSGVSPRSRRVGQIVRHGVRHGAGVLHGQRPVAAGVGAGFHQAGAPVPLSAFARMERGNGAAADHASGAVSVDDAVVQPGAGRVAGGGGGGAARGGGVGRDAGQHHHQPGGQRRRVFGRRCPASRC